MSLNKELENFLLSVWNTVLNDTFPVMRGNLAVKEWHVSQKAGMGMFLGDIYKAVEQSLRAIIEEAEGKRILKDESWHMNLLESAVELGLVPEAIRTTLRGMLRYRHMVIHGYGVRLDESFIRQKAPEAMEAFVVFIEHVANKYELSSMLLNLRNNCNEKDFI